MFLGWIIWKPCKFGIVDANIQTLTYCMELIIYKLLLMDNEQWNWAVITTGNYCYSNQNLVLIKVLVSQSSCTLEPFIRMVGLGQLERNVHQSSQKACLFQRFSVFYLVAQMVKNPPAMQETWVWSLGQEDPLEKEMATHSSTLAWIIPWMEESGGLQSMGSQRVRNDWATKHSNPRGSVGQLRVICSPE